MKKFEMFKPKFTYRETLAMRGMDLIAKGLQYEQFRNLCPIGSVERFELNCQVILINWELRELNKAIGGEHAP